MAKLLKLRRGTTTQHGSFTGAEGEVTIDTTKDTAVVHDGAQAGGRPLAREDMSNVPAGTILGTQLENSGVTAGAYGSSSAIPIVTVDAQGLVTAASTTAIDSTTIANGTSNVAVANNGDITTTRSGTARLVVDNQGVDVTGKLTTTDNITITSVAPKIFLVDSDTNDDFSINGDGGTFRIKSETDSADRFVVNSDGHVDIPGDLDVGAGITLQTSNNNDIFKGTSSNGIKIASDSISFQQPSSPNNNYAVFNNNGCDLRVANAQKLVVDSSGTAITGNLDVSSGVDVTGNITVTGTVDGRDVAGDGALLDGITNSSTIGEIKSTATLANGVVATTQAASDNSTKVATTAYVTTGIANAQAFPSGTVMLFQQTNAPTGWTKVTSGVNNKSLRVVSGTVGSGGNVAFTTAFGSRGINANAGDTTQGGNISVANTTAGGNVNISSVSTSGNVNSHTLSSNEMPSHSHNIRGNTNSGYHSTNQYGGCHVQGDRPYKNAGYRYTSYNGHDAGRTENTGGNGGHSHGFSGSSHNHNGSLSGTAHNHNATFTGSAHNHSISVDNLDMQVEYLDVIIASKD